MAEQMEVSGTITHHTATPISIEVTKGQRGSHGWTISVKGQDAAAIMQTIHECETLLQAAYPQEIKE